MRIRTGHGPDDWTISEPSSARIPGHRGSLVTGGPGPNDKDVHNRRNAVAKALTKNQAKLDARPIKTGRPRIYTEDEAVAARRRAWRESKARRRAA